MKFTPRLGFQISEAQFFLFWKLFKAACAYQGWSKSEREEKRKWILWQCGRWNSLKEVDARRGYDSVKDRLEQLAGIVHNQAEDAGDRRRLMAGIEAAKADLLAAGYAPAAIDTIMRERFKLIDGASVIKDLPTEELRNAIRTLKSRLATFKRKASATPMQGDCETNFQDRKATVDDPFFMPSRP